MAERRRQVYPMTADLAGVLAAAEMQRATDHGGTNRRLGGAVVRWVGWVVSRMPVRRRTADPYEVRIRSA